MNVEDLAIEFYVVFRDGIVRLEERNGHPRGRYADWPDLPEDYRAAWLAVATRALSHGLVSQNEPH
jgi:hypothetical protein